MEFDKAANPDIDQLCDLLSTLFDQEAEFKPDLEAQKNGLSHIISDPRVGCVLVARRDNAVLGMVNILFTVSTALGSRVAMLEDMVVSPAARGQNIGSQLLEYAVDIAREEGCKRITLLTDGDNLGAHKFYQRHGFVQSSMVPFRVVI